MWSDQKKNANKYKQMYHSYHTQKYYNKHVDIFIKK